VFKKKKERAPNIYFCNGRKRVFGPFSSSPMISNNIGGFLDIGIFPPDLKGILGSTCMLIETKSFSI
jgi:hypothetical protein